MRRALKWLLLLGVAGGATATATYQARQDILRVGLDLPPFTHELGPSQTVQVPAPGGVHLHTRVILPAGEGPFPAIVIRNPYNLWDAFSVVCETFARYGYACVHQDVRGRMGSEGEWSPLVNERADGMALFAWLREQPFQDGHWALWGMSYLAAVQWAVADELPSEVKTMVSMVFGVDVYRVMYERGLFRHEVFSAWAALMPAADLAFLNGYAYRDLISRRPLREADEGALGRPLEWYRAWLDASEPIDPFWTQDVFTAFRDAPARVEVPVMMLGAWFDPFFESQLVDFHRLKTRADSKMIVGPWNHLQLPAADFELPEDFGFGGQLRLVQDWLDHHLKGEPLHQAVGVIETYDLGDGGWRRRMSFPSGLEKTRSFSLQRSEITCPIGPVGRLSTTATRAHAPIEYVYDPADPTPASGGAASLAFAIPTFGGVEPGAREEPPPCQRDDIASFVSEPLDAPLHLVGAPVVELRVQSDAEDTAFGFELMAKPPGETSWLYVREAYGTARFVAESQGTPYAPDTPFSMRLSAWPIEWTFPAGTELRVDVRSAAFPVYAAHPNVGGRWAAAKEARVAHQQLLSGSRLLLPEAGGDGAVLSASDLGRVPAMACTFQIDLPGAAEDIIAQAKSMIEKQGGTFNGTESAGSYALKLPVGTVEGTYSVVGKAIQFDIKKKPMLVPCGTIESFIRGHLK